MQGLYKELSERAEATARESNSGGAETLAPPLAKPANVEPIKVRESEPSHRFRDVFWAVLLANLVSGLIAAIIYTATTTNR